MELNLFKKGMNQIMRESVLIEVSDIMDSFDEEQMSKLVHDQIYNYDNSDASGDIVTDHFKPIYFKYISLNNYEMDDDVKVMAATKYAKICNMIVDEISNKFNFTIDKDWYNSSEKNMSAITLALYAFFVLDIKSNLTYILHEYINRNFEALYKNFEDCKNKKDASTLANKKEIPIEKAVIISNIYDITDYIMNDLTEEEFFDYMEKDYLPLSLVKTIFDEGNMSGNFMEALNTFYRKNLPMKSSICFDIISYIKNSNKGENDK